MGGQRLEKLLVGKKFLVKCHLNKIGFHLKKDSAPRGFIDGALPFGASGGHLSAPSTSEKIIKENELNAALFPNRSLCTGHKNIYVGGVLRGRNLCPVPPKTNGPGWYLEMEARLPVVKKAAFMKKKKSSAQPDWKRCPTGMQKTAGKAWRFTLATGGGVKIFLLGPATHGDQIFPYFH